jgi:redox-sensitive bicupin YhaK (pirin superfamily)
VLAGRGTVGRELRSIRMGQLAAFGQGDALTVAADATQETRSPTLDVLVLGGRPIGEPVVAYGPFVMNTKEQIVQAIVDYQAGRLGSIPAEAIMPHGDVRAETEGDSTS